MLNNMLVMAVILLNIVACGEVAFDGLEKNDDAVKTMFMPKRFYFKPFPVSSVGAPEPRYKPNVGFVQYYDSIFVWGGRKAEGPDGLLSTGGILQGYLHSSQGKWTHFDDTNAPLGREAHVAHLMSYRLLVWGGCREWRGTECVQGLGDGAIYDINSARWLPMSKVGAPSPRFDVQSIRLFSSKLMIWGGRAPLVDGETAGEILGDGAIYDIETDTWTPVASENAPEKRYGADMLVSHDGVVSMVGGSAYGGGLYDGGKNRWSPLTFADVLGNTGSTWTYRFPFKDTSPFLMDEIVCCDANGGHIFFEKGTSERIDFSSHTVDPYDYEPLTRLDNRRGVTPPQTTRFVTRGSKIYAWSEQRLSAAVVYDNETDRWHPTMRPDIVLSPRSDAGFVAAWEMYIRWGGRSGTELRNDGIVYGIDRR